MRLERIDHVGIAVEDLDASVRLYEQAFGVTVERREVVDSDGVEEAMLSVGESYIQLLAPTRADSPVAKFLARNGPGLHHVGYAVASVSQALDHLRNEGVRLVDEVPRRGGGGHTVAFVHPKAAFGTLIELVQE